MCQLVLWIILPGTVCMKAIGHQASKGRRRFDGFGALPDGAYQGSGEVQRLFTSLNLKSWSWPQITALVKTIVSNMDSLQARVEAVGASIAYHVGVGAGLISALSLVLLVALVWCYRNWGRVREMLTKWKDQPAPGFDNIRRVMGDFFKIRAMPLGGDWNPLPNHQMQPHFQQQGQQPVNQMQPHFQQQGQQPVNFGPPQQFPQAGPPNQGPASPVAANLAQRGPS